MKEYIVTVEIDHCGYTMESNIEVEAYSEDEAISAAEEKALTNLLIVGQNITQSDEDNEDELSDYVIETSIELNGYNVVGSIEVEAYSEDEAISTAEEKTLDNVVINAINTTTSYSD